MNSITGDIAGSVAPTIMTDRKRFSSVSTPNVLLDCRLRHASLAHRSMIDTAGVMPAPVHTSTTVEPNTAVPRPKTQRGRGRAQAVFVAKAQSNGGLDIMCNVNCLNRQKRWRT